DVEAELAIVLDLAELGPYGAGLTLCGGRDVLHAHLEAHGRLALIQVLERENSGVPLDHPDHAGGGEDTRADRPADVGHQLPLDDELVGALDAGFQHQTAAPPLRVRGRLWVAAELTPSPARRRPRGSRRSRRRRRRMRGTPPPRRPPRAGPAGAAAFRPSSSR